MTYKEKFYKLCKQYNIKVEEDLCHNIKFKLGNKTSSSAKLRKLCGESFYRKSVEMMEELL